MGYGDKATIGFTAFVFMTLLLAFVGWCDSALVYMYKNTWLINTNGGERQKEKKRSTTRFLFDNVPECYICYYSLHPFLEYIQLKNQRNCLLLNAEYKINHVNFYIERKISAWLPL